MIQLNNEEGPLERSKDAEKARRCTGRGGAGAQVRNQAVRPGRRGSGKLEADPETLFKAAFDALDRSPDDASRVALLRRVHAGSYDRLTADRAAIETQALTGRKEAAPADLQSSGPGALDAFRGIS
jgi:hypothetical protein